MEKFIINIPDDRDKLVALTPGSLVMLTGDLFVMRDAAHKRYTEDLAQNAAPFDIRGAAIYYMGPTPAFEGEIIGSAGPTTSARMDDYAPMLYDLGMLASIGKGARSENVIQAVKRNNAVYLAAIGGAGALYQSRIKSVTPIAYADLGAEACIKIRVEDFPCIVKYSYTR